MEFIENNTSLATDLRRLFNTQILSDVTFIIQGQRFFAHKVLLVARSPYFFNLIGTNTAAKLEIEVQDATPQIFYGILEYIYTNTTMINALNVWAVYQAAQFYQLTGLLQRCEGFLIGSLDESNVFQIWKTARQMQLSMVADHCVAFVRERFENCLKKTDFDLDNITEADLQQMLPGADSYQMAELYKAIQQAKQQKMLQKFTFPAPANKTNNNNIATANASSSSSNSKTTSAAATTNADHNNHHNNNPLASLFLNQFTHTQTLELPSEFTTPPAAFPTIDTMAAFPQFFNVLKPEQLQLANSNNNNNSSSSKDCTDNNNNNSGSNSNSNNGKSVKLAAPDANNKPNNNNKTAGNKSKSRIVTRRLSVISNASDLGVVFQHVISCVTRMMNADRTSLFLYDEETDELCSQVAIGECEIRIPSKSGIAGSVFQTGKSVNVKDAYTDSKFHKDVDKSTGYSTRFVLCAPVYEFGGNKNNKNGSGSNGEKKMLGVIEVLNKRTGPFDETDEQNLKTIASLISVLLDTPDLPRHQVLLLPPIQHNDSASLNDTAAANTTDVAATLNQLVRKASLSGLNLSNETMQGLLDDLGIDIADFPLEPFEGDQFDHLSAIMEHENVTQIGDLIPNNNVYGNNSAAGPMNNFGKGLLPPVQGLASTITPATAVAVAAAAASVNNNNNNQMVQLLQQQQQQQTTNQQQPFIQFDPLVKLETAATPKAPSSSNKKRESGGAAATPTSAGGSSSPSPSPSPSLSPSNANNNATNNNNNNKKRKKNSIPFMHFRIPRYELQFIQYNGKKHNNNGQQ